MVGVCSFVYSVFVAGAEAAAKAAWNLALQNAIKRAAGHKVIDNVAVLKKKIKKREHKLKKSRSEWSDRMKSVEEKKRQRQLTRKENISKYRGKRLGAKNPEQPKAEAEPGYYFFAIFVDFILFSAPEKLTRKQRANALKDKRYHTDKHSKKNKKTSNSKSKPDKKF